MDYIRRNMAGQRTQMAQGKLSRLAREVAVYRAGGLAAIGALQSKGWLQLTHELDLSRVAMSVTELQQQIGELEAPQRPSHLHMRLKPSHRSGELVLRTKGLAVGYPGNVLFEAEDIELHRQEIAALIGPNGSGKSTFLKTILEQLPPLAGEIKLGASLSLAYFAQAHETLHPENTVLDELLNRENIPISEARNYLALFLFRGDDVYKRVSMLSGGERGRLSLALLAREQANFLLLDEPTNHLDIPAQETLQEAMAQYGGTILMVSHDRYLVDRLATQVWEVVDGRLCVTPGNYQAYLAARQQEKEAAKEATQSARPVQPTAETPQNETALSKNEQRRLVEMVTMLERHIEMAEKELQRTVVALQQATEEQSFDKIQSLSAAYAEAENNLNTLLAQWEKLHE